MARLSGQKRNQNRIANNAAKKQANIEKEIARIKGGGGTWFGKEKALKNLNEKLKESGGTKKSKLKIEGAGPTKGAAAAQEMARKRIKEGRNTVTGELKKPKNSKGSSTTTTTNRRGRKITTTTPKKRKRIKSELWD